MTPKRFVKQFLSSLHRHHKSQGDIYIFSVPRSGSTLLAEVLNSNSASKTASEVFSLNAENRAVLKEYIGENSISDRYVDLPSDQYQNILKYFADLSDGKTWNSFYWSDLFTKNHNYNTSRTIFKTHKVTYHFDSLMSHFKDDYAIYLLRHPIAVSLSRIRMGWTTYIDQYEESIKIKRSISQEMRSSIKEIKEKGSELEKQVLNWCLENSVFIQLQLNNSLPKNLITIYYEDLVLWPEKSLKDLCAQINIAFHPEMLKIMQLPSTGIVHSKKETTRAILNGKSNSLISNWKSEVDQPTLRRLEHLIKIFGFDFYLE